MNAAMNPWRSGQARSLPRSYLYVPGNSTDKLLRAFTRGADALIVDLEDAVPPADKDAARSDVVRWLADTEPGSAQIWVRVNSGAARAEDVAALTGSPSITGLALAKLDDPDEIADVVAMLTAGGDESTLLMPVLETARAILSAAAIARQPRVDQLQIGEVDLAADTGISAGSDEAELAALRAQVVLASAGAGINPPVGPVSREFRDLGLLEESTLRLRRQGFFGRCCIHPAQLDVVHQVFTPTESEVADAGALLTRFEAAVANGSGLLLDENGRLVDVAVVRYARRVLDVSRERPVSRERSAE